ncbi:MAG: CDP-paratose 2-epimerase [Gaiellaceae bacterium]|nr:CDP-paratose 2-epimerase [Gaiellaceae bacterium]
MTQLVVGGAGFIGANLADHLLKSGSDVVIADDFSRVGSRENVRWLSTRHAGLRVEAADVARGPEVLEPLVRGASVVYHFAGQVAVTKSIEDPRRDFEVNALGTLNLLEAVRAANPEAVLVYASTNKVYGALEDLPVDEEGTRYAFSAGRTGIDEGQPLDFHSPYGCSKGAADQYVADYSRTYGLRTIVLRQSCIYGQRQFGVEDQGWLAWFAIAAALGREITIFGDGKQVRDVLHVDDLVDLIGRAVAKSESVRAQVYNVGGGPEAAVSLLEAIGLIERHLGRPLDVSFSEARTGDQRIYVSDTRRARDELGWQPRVGVRDGIAQLMSWIEANRSLFAVESSPA